MGVVIGLAVDVHLDRMTEHIVESQFLNVPLYPVDVKIDHHFLKRPLAPAEDELQCCSLDTLLGPASRNESAVQKTLFVDEPVQLNIRVRAVRNCGFVLQGCVVQSNNGIRIEYPALGNNVPNQTRSF